MQGQTSTLSSVHRPLLILLSSAQRSVSRHVSTFSTCGWRSSLWANYRLVILSFLAALFRLKIPRLENHAGARKRKKYIDPLVVELQYMQDVYIHTRCIIITQGQYRVRCDLSGYLWCSLHESSKIRSEIVAGGWVNITSHAHAQDICNHEY